MIAKSAIDAFLKAKLESYDWVKDLPDKDLDAELKKLGVCFQLPPFRHQKEMMLLGIYLQEFLFFADMGLGKTAVALNLAGFFKKSGQEKATLACVPNLINIDNWEREVRIHAPDLRILPLYGSSKERFSSIERSDADLYVINYAGLVAMFTETISTVKRGKEIELSVVDNDMVDAFGELIDGLILDECHKVKNIQSLSYKICNRLAENCSYRFGMTGTPFGTDPQDLWSQFKIIDGGKTLGKTITLYRESFFKKKKNHWGGYDFELKSWAKTALHNRIKNRSIEYDADDCSDIPERFDEIVYVPFPPENFSYYLKLIEAVRSANRQLGELDNTYVKMRQLASGYLSLKGDDDSKVQVQFSNNPKLEATLELVESLPRGKKMVIFHEYVHTGKMISDALKKAKVNHVRLYGGTKDKKGTISKFLDDPKCRVLVVNHESGGTGLNLQVANYMIIFEMPRSMITHKQILKRLHRTGQRDYVFVYYLLMRKSIDVSSYESWVSGQEVFDHLIKGEESFINSLTQDEVRVRRN